MKKLSRSADVNKKETVLFQCRVSDIDVKANRTWKYFETHCVSCKNIAIKETGLHILECKVLSDKNNQISYIPDYNDLFSKDIMEQIYTSRMMNEHMQIRKSILEAQAKEALKNATGSRELTMSCSAATFV